MGFSRQEHWSGLPFPPPGDLPDPGIKPTSPTSPALPGKFFTTASPGQEGINDSQVVEAELAEWEPLVPPTGGLLPALPLPFSQHLTSLWDLRCSVLSLRSSCSNRLPFPLEWSRHAPCSSRLILLPLHFKVLAWRIPWTEDPGGLQSMGLQKSQTRLSD